MSALCRIWWRVQPGAPASWAGSVDVGVCQRLGGLAEDFLGAPIGQPRPAADGVDVGGGQGDAGAAVGEEHRAAGAAVEQPGKQAGRAADDDVDCRSLAGDLRAPVAAVEVLDVQGELTTGAWPARLAAMRSIFCSPAINETRTRQATAVVISAPAITIVIMMFRDPTGEEQAVLRDHLQELPWAGTAR